uniref:Uncharacterized protein n=1 Tax=Salix viminalis TaxID=40686 RepID=A0A6N2MPF0_SALVM
MNRKMPTKWKLFIVSPEPSGLALSYTRHSRLDSFDDLLPDKNTWNLLLWINQLVVTERRRELSELSLPGAVPKKPSRGLTNLMLNALLRQADSERFMAVLKLRGTGHQLSILPLAVDRRSDVLKSGEGYKCSFFHGIQ